MAESNDTNNLILVTIMFRDQQFYNYAKKKVDAFPKLDAEMIYQIQHNREKWLSVYAIYLFKTFTWDDKLLISYRRDGLVEKLLEEDKWKISDHADKLALVPQIHVNDQKNLLYVIDTFFSELWNEFAITTYKHRYPLDFSNISGRFKQLDAVKKEDSDLSWGNVVYLASNSLLHHIKLA